MRNNGRLGYGIRLFVVTLLIYSAACTDGPVETGQKAAGATRPSLVETVPLPDGQSLLGFGLDDARGVSKYNYGYRSLDPAVTPMTCGRRGQTGLGGCVEYWGPAIGTYTSRKCVTSPGIMRSCVRSVQRPKMRA